MNKFAASAILSILATCAVLPHSARAEEAVEVQAAAAAVPKAAAVKPAPGKTLYDVQGKRLGAIYAVEEKRSVSLMLDGRVVVVPFATLSMVQRKITTSLTQADLLKRR